MASDEWAWPTVPLGSIARFRAGSAFKPEHQGEAFGEIPFIKVSDFSLPGNDFEIRSANNWVSKGQAKAIKAAIHPAGATVFAKIGVALTYNRRRLLVRDTAIDNNLMSATPVDEKVSSDYLYFLLCYLDFNSIANGSALPYINVSDLQKLEVGLPSRAEQAEVSDFLGSLVRRIDLLRQTNATLESIAQALFKSWFIDFAPVRAKTEGREPEGMDAATAALFPAEFEESGTGLIPVGWTYRPAEELFEVGIGKTPPRKESHWFSDGSGDMRWLSIKDMGYEGAIASRSSEFLSNKAVAIFNVRVVPSCCVPDDHIVLSRLPLFQARTVLRDLFKPPARRTRTPDDVVGAPFPLAGRAGGWVDCSGASTKA